MNNWISFKEKHPTLGLMLDIKVDDKEHLNIGKLLMLRDVGGGWIVFETENWVGAAVRPEYQWRETIL